MENAKPMLKREHIVWLDVVRFVAMFTVVCCHSADPFNFYPGEPPANIDDIKFWGAAYGAFLRPCVPLFVMITGALLLPVKGDTSAFYKKRISRVFFSFSYLVGYLQSVSVGNRFVGTFSASHSRLFPLFGRRSHAPFVGSFDGVHLADTF